VKIYLHEKLHPITRLCAVSQFLDSQTAKGKYEDLQVLGSAKKSLFIQNYYYIITFVYQSNYLEFKQ
jgi:hypothetical protein